MSEAASAAAELAGQVDTTPAGAPDPGNAGPWYGEVESDLGGYIENKGWKSAKDMASGYQNLEKLFGADRAGNTIAIPKPDDKEAWSNLYGRLGRPGEASQYQLNPPQDADEQLTQWFQEQAFAIGLSNDQASTLYSQWNDMSKGLLESQNQQDEQQQIQDIADLKKEWGLQYDANKQAGQRAARQFNLDADALDKMESALGTKSFFELMSNIGKSIGEDSYETGEGQPGFTMSPAAAQNAIASKKMDSQFQETYLNAEAPGHKEAVAEMERLMKFAYPGA